MTIIAADKGNPSLEGVCSFIVAIEDVNDNSPLFDRISYNEKIKQQTPVGSDIFRLSSTDNDADNNAAIEYSLQPDSSDSKFLEYFKVNPESGWVSLQKPIDTVSCQFLLTIAPKILWLMKVNVTCAIYLME